jgi:hypothetical protein
MEIVANDPGSYFYENMSTDSSIINFYPSIVDIAATAINHVFPNLTNKDFQSWGLDGRSWLNFNIEKTVDFYSESNIQETTQKECKYFNNACSIEITLKEFKK